MISRTSKVFSLSLAQSVLMVVNLVAGIVFARTLSVEDYGTYLQTFLAYDFAVPILTMGLPSALYYFLPGEAERKKGIVLDNLLLLFFAGLIFSLFLFLGGTELLTKRFNNPNLSYTLRWMIFYPLYTFPILINSAVWVIQDKVNLNAKYNVFTGIILAAALIVAALLTHSYEAPTLVRIVLPLAYFPFVLYLIFKYVPGRWDMPNLLSMWKMAKFSIPLGLASVFGTLSIQLAGIIVSFLTTPDEYAVYANGAKEVPFISIITGSISVVIMADMAKDIKNGRLETALKLFRKAASISASFLFPIMFFLMTFSESFIDILYSNKYSGSVIPFRIYLLVIPVRIAYYGSAFIALGRTKTILYRSFIDLLLTFLLCYFFVKLFGAYGAALGLILTLYIWTIPFNLMSLSKSFKTKIMYMLPFRKLFRILLISFFAAIVSSSLFFLNLSSIVEFLFGIIFYWIVYILLAIKYIDDFKDTAFIYLKKIFFIKKTF